MKPRIVVIGSANMDMIIRTSHIPRVGETILGEDFIQSLGGKGANQAIAAARLGADVTFIARLGNDHFGRVMLESYKQEGVDISHIIIDGEYPTGVALILIDSKGENVICVAPGANAKLSVDDIAASEDVIKSADYVLLQLEIPIVTVEYAIRLAAKYHVRVVLNPAPIAKISRDILELIDVLTPNHSEAIVMAEEKGSLSGEVALALRRKFNIKNVVITMGKNGTAISSESSPIPKVIPGFIVDPVDITGAGDAFNSGLAFALASGLEVEEAVRYANAVGALAITRLGAQSSLPTSEEVAAFLYMNPRINPNESKPTYVVIDINGLGRRNSLTPGKRRKNESA